MKIREYKPDDRVEVKELILSILKNEYPFDQNAYQDTDINDISGTYSGEISAFFVIEDGKKIVGTVGVKKDTENCALIRRLFVDKDYRKRGFGTMLLKRAIEFCTLKNYKTAFFRATDRMAQAISLCKKMGFREIESLEVGGFHIHKLLLTL